MDEINNFIHDAMKEVYLKVITYKEFSEYEDSEVFVEIYPTSQSVVFKRSDYEHHLPAIAIIAEIVCIARKEFIGGRPVPEWISVREAKAMLKYAKAIEDMRSL